MVALLLLLIAMVLFLLAAFRGGTLRGAHLGWLGLAVLAFVQILAGAPYGL